MEKRNVSGQTTTRGLWRSEPQLAASSRCPLSTPLAFSMSAPSGPASSLPSRGPPACLRARFVLLRRRCWLTPGSLGLRDHGAREGEAHGHGDEEQRAHGGEEGRGGGGWRRECPASARLSR
jgi:hypothetical protein